MKYKLRYKIPQRKKVQQDKYNVRLLKKSEVIEKYRQHIDCEYQR